MFVFKHIIHILQETENKEESGMVSVYSNIKLSAVIHPKVILLLLNSANFEIIISLQTEKILIKPQRSHCILHGGIAGQFTLKISFSRKSAIINV